MVEFYVTDEAKVWCQILCFGFVNLMFKYIKIGITIFKLFVWGDISSYIQSDIISYGSDDIGLTCMIKFPVVSPQNNFEYIYPLI